jgi:hypothetical protein
MNADQKKPYLPPEIAKFDLSKKDTFVLGGCKTDDGLTTSSSLIFPCTLDFSCKDSYTS